MAGIYIHIPFCKQACHYCDFHFSTNMVSKGAMVEAICKEAFLQRNYLPAGEPVTTIYLGGGTPSLLNSNELGQIFKALHQHFTIAPDAEITLEANPDDLTEAKLAELKRTPVNRLSIGIQSFHEPHLRLMNRAHSATEALQCVTLARQAGFDNITVDLIYGIPAPDHSIWLSDLEQLFKLNVQHVSCYALTIEKDTALGRWTQKGKFKPGEEEFVAEQFEILLEQMQQHGFEQYEISNFCRPGYESKHNSNYWRGVTYVGLGPSAHSFNGSSRQYNVAHNYQYLAALENDVLNYTKEELTPEDRINEYIMTSLRTKWGCDLKQLKTKHSFDLATVHKTYLAELLQKNLIRIENEVLYLTDAGKLLADQISLDLFLLPADGEVE